MSTTQDQLLSAIKDLDPSNPWSIIGPTFDKVELAESVIASVRSHYPSHGTRLWNAFALLMPSKLLYEVPETMYRNHCAELLTRVRKSLDTTLGTKAEIMMALSKSSLQHPLAHVASVLCAQLFQEILPNTSIAREIADLGTKSYERETDRLLADLAQKTRVPDRKPKKESEWRTPPE